MTRFRYKEGFLFCNSCGKQYKIEECPDYQSKIQKWKVCPKCPQKYKLRSKPHNKNSTIYYRNVIKPQLDKDREIIVKWKQKRYDKIFSNSSREQQQEQEIKNNE